MECILIGDSEENKLNEYWTEYQMKKASPMPLPEWNKETSKLLQGYQQESLEDPPGKEDSKVIATPGVPTLSDINSRPPLYVGKLFATATIPDDTSTKDISGYCTASFIGRSDILLTAQHCVQNLADWFKNFYFVRAYNGASRPMSLSNYVVKRICAWIPSYITRDYIRYDYAFLHVTRETPEYPNRKRGSVGYLGFDADAIRHMTRETPNSPITDKIIAIGYPKNYGHGESMYQVEGKIKKIIKIGSFSAEMSNNPFDQYSSGSPWVTSSEGIPPYDRDHYVIGIITNRGESPNTVIGPLFDERFMLLYQKIVE